MRRLLAVLALAAAGCGTSAEKESPAPVRLSAPEPVFRAQSPSGAGVPAFSGEGAPSAALESVAPAEVPELRGEPVRALGGVVPLDADNYGEFVAKGDRPVLAMYGFAGCRWCVVAAPVLDALAERDDLAPVLIAKADIEAARPAPEPPGFAGYPGFAFFKGGKAVHISGLGPTKRADEGLEAYRKRIEDWLAGEIRARLIGSGREPGAARTYGLIVNGDREPRHLENAERVGAFFSRHYGVAARDLYVLSPGRGRAAVRGNILAAAAELRVRLGPGDRLVVYTTGHGTRAGGRTQLVLQDGGLISDAEFAGALLDNRAAETVYIGDQCYSGGFADAFAATSKRVKAMSASDAENTTSCQTFIRPFLAAFADPAGDSDRDGRVDEAEAFAVARRRHRASLGARSANAQWRSRGEPGP